MSSQEEMFDLKILAWLHTWRQREDVKGRCVTASFEGRRRFPSLRLAYGIAFDLPISDAIDRLTRYEAGDRDLLVQAMVHFWLFEGGPRPFDTREGQRWKFWPKGLSEPSRAGWVPVEDSTFRAAERREDCHVDG